MLPRSKTIKQFAVEMQLKGEHLVSSIFAKVLPGVDASVRRRILFIEDRVPHPHLGAGYPRSNVILWDLTRMGYEVTLYPLIYPKEPEETAHEDIPPEVKIAMGHGSAGLRRFLTERRGRYGLIFVSRPHNMAVLRHVLPIMRRPRIVYDAEALFCLRGIEQLRAEGLPLSAAAEQQMISKEVGLAAGSRCVISVSELERSRFVAHGFKRVFILSHSVEPRPTPAPFDRRKDFLFVGPVDNVWAPNAVAVTWFAREILPRIREQLGQDVRFLIAGHHSAAIVAAVGGGVEFLGRVEDLTATYNSARAFVAPLRIAAGIPLKVIEAAAYGLPVVGTKLMATQLVWQDGVEMLTANTAEEFAAACVRLYGDIDVWNDLRLNALQRVQNDHSPETFSRKLRLVLEEALKA